MKLRAIPLWLALAVLVGGNQHPVVKGEPDGVLPLAKVRRQ